MIDASSKGKGRGVTIRLAVAWCGTMSLKGMYDMVCSVIIRGLELSGMYLDSQAAEC
jgi:hypothetical protein